MKHLLALHSNYFSFLIQSPHADGHRDSNTLLNRYALTLARSRQVLFVESTRLPPLIVSDRAWNISRQSTNEPATSSSYGFFPTGVAAAARQQTKALKNPARSHLIAYDRGLLVTLVYTTPVFSIVFTFTTTNGSRSRLRPAFHLIHSLI